MLGVVLLPFAAAAVLALVRIPPAVARWVWLALTLVELALLGVVTALALPLGPGRLGLEERSATLPGVGVSWHLGVDGLSLPLLLLTGVLFAVCALWEVRQPDRPRPQAALFLFLQGTCTGLFAAQDLLLFFLFFDLSIVGMTFSISGWGRGNRRGSALLFFLYTFAGSIVLLVGFIGLAVGSGGTPDFDLTDRAPFTAGPAAALVVLAAIVVGLAVKTPAVPFHSWLPPAHTDAPTVGSVILAGLLLKTGTFGFVRIAMPLLPDAWRAIAWVVLAVGIASVLWGALVAMAQTDLKRLIAYTSVNHMGLVLVAVGAAGIGGNPTAPRLAVTGAVVLMVSHGLTTGALFLLAGVLRDRRGTSLVARFGGLAQVAPRFAALTVVAVLASLGLPAFSGFVAEFQILTGAIGATPWAAVVLPGLVLTAALLLRAAQAILTGERTPAAEEFADLRAHETVAIGALLLLSLGIGVAPWALNGLVQPAAQHLVALLMP